jgi:putative Holliday junction resolvase
MARLIAFDVGDARIGVAMSDYMGLLASPYTTIYVPRQEEQLWPLIQSLILETEAEQLVIGLPISLDGQIHAQGQRVQDFAARLQTRIEIPCVFWDERLSTVEAQRRLNESGGRLPPPGRRGAGQKRKKKGSPGQSIDALAATIILQDYLDHLTRQ